MCIRDRLLLRNQREVIRIQPPATVLVVLGELRVQHFDFLLIDKFEDAQHGEAVLIRIDSVAVGVHLDQHVEVQPLEHLGFPLLSLNLRGSGQLSALPLGRPFAGRASALTVEMLPIATLAMSTLARMKKIENIRLP